VEWVEPFNQNADPVFCRVSEETAVATQRQAALSRNPSNVYATDEQALDDFMTVRWAVFCEAPKGWSERGSQEGSSP
jgi:hypothetical protein